MSRKKKKRAATSRNLESARRKRRAAIGGSAAAILALFLFAAFWFGKNRTEQKKPEARASHHGEVTFNRDVAPIIFQSCAGCHRPGQSAPFALLNYGDVKKHAKDIASVTSHGYMPPWPPEHGVGEFIGERHLDPGQVALIKDWVDQGCREGNPKDLPPLPTWSGEWQLGAPDLVVTMPRAYQLSPEGRDIYRNFVVPVSISAPKYVRAIEFRPKSKVVHHAFIRIDRTGQARRLEEREKTPGFPGITLSAEAPGGNFLSWQPGRGATTVPEGLAFGLHPGDSFVFQIHMHPSGKLEPVQAEMGLYFTEQPPTNTALRVLLTSTCIDIPAGDPSYELEDEYRLPIDAHLLAILPHAHYLARDISAWAISPDGRTIPLIHIPNWDFNWQSDYRYKTPVFLPKGTRLSMRFRYDNSTNNTSNPNQPPREVTFGRQTTDEMAELWFQLLPTRHSDIAVFQDDYGRKVKARMAEGANFALRKNPDDPEALATRGDLLYARGKYAEAEAQFRHALRGDAKNAGAHHGLGLVLRRKERPDAARLEFEKALESDPWDYQAHGNLGMIYLDLGDLDSASLHFNEALRINPKDEFSRTGLQTINQARGTQSRGR